MKYICQQCGYSSKKYGNLLHHSSATEHDIVLADSAESAVVETWRDWTYSDLQNGDILVDKAVHRWSVSQVKKHDGMVSFMLYSPQAYVRHEYSMPADAPCNIIRTEAKR